MNSDKIVIERMLDKIELIDQAPEKSELRLIVLRKSLENYLGGVLWDIAVSPDYEWACYRDHTVADLLTALGIEVEGRFTERAVRPLPPRDISLQELLLRIKRYGEGSKTDKDSGRHDK